MGQNKVARKRATPTADTVIAIQVGNFSLTIGRAFTTVLTTIMLARLGSSAHLDLGSLVGASAGAFRIVRKLWKG
jgi:hypothetical protein